MTGPAVSVVVPTFNEEAAIESFLDRVGQFLAKQTPSWEILVADDGSSDRTPMLVDARAGREPAVRLLKLPHRGKGAAVRDGLLAARGAWRLMADADLSVPPDDWQVLLSAARRTSAPDLIIGSREAPGSRRIGESTTRHVVGRAFNWIVQALAVPGINDTQCGFKILSARAADTLCPHLTLDGFAFDVEMLFLARRAGFSIEEVGVVWTGRADSRVRLTTGATAFVDILGIRWRQLTGRYAHLARQPDELKAGIKRAAS